MRHLACTALILGALTGCNKTEGSWLVFATLTANSADPDDAMIGVEQRVVAGFAETSEGTLILSYDGLLLAGELGDENTFAVGVEAGEDFTSEDCDTAIVKTDWECTGNFPDKGVMTGTLSRMDDLLLENCPDLGDDADLQQSWTWSLDGVRVDANDGSHLGDANWGDFPSPVI